MAVTYAKFEKKNLRFIGGETDEQKLQLINQQEEYMKRNTSFQSEEKDEK